MKKCRKDYDAKVRWYPNQKNVRTCVITSFTEQTLHGITHSQSPKYTKNIFKMHNKFQWGNNGVASLCHDPHGAWWYKIRFKRVSSVWTVLTNTIYFPIVQPMDGDGNIGAITFTNLTSGEYVINLEVCSSQLHLLENKVERWRGFWCSKDRDSSVKPGDSPQKNHGDSVTRWWFTHLMVLHTQDGDSCTWW